jgi:hypothetical protein
MSTIKKLGTWRSIRWMLLALACAVGALSEPAPAGATEYCCLYITEVEYYAWSEVVGFCTYNVNCTNDYVCSGQITTQYRIARMICCPNCSE